MEPGGSAHNYKGQGTIDHSLKPNDMKTPFTHEQFFALFEKYNSEIFPFQLVILLLGMVMLWIQIKRYSHADRIIGGIIGLLWLWTGIVYHLLCFSAINPAARVFGLFFILQGVLIGYFSIIRPRLVFDNPRKSIRLTGYFFIVFGLFIYPVIGYLLEGSFKTVISLGLPCPTTILTFGFFMLASRKFPGYLLVIPTLWAILGLVPALQFGVYQDFVLIISAVVANFIWWRK